MASVLVFNEPDAFRVLDVDAPPERIVRAVNQGRWELYLPDEQGPLFAHQQGSIVVITHSETTPKNGPPPIQPAGTAGVGAVGGGNDHRSDRHCAGIERAHDPRLCGQYERRDWRRRISSSWWPGRLRWGCSGRKCEVKSKEAVQFGQPL